VDICEDLAALLRRGDMGRTGLALAARPRRRQHRVPLPFSWWCKRGPAPIILPVERNIENRTNASLVQRGAEAEPWLYDF
jgi:hypothetical protein